MCGTLVMIASTAALTMGKLVVNPAREVVTLMVHWFVVQVAEQEIQAQTYITANV